MTREQFAKDFCTLMRTAKSLEMHDTAELLLMVYMSMTYIPGAQTEIRSEVKAIVAKWAKISRESREAADSEDEKEWFREFEWPEDLNS